MSLSPKYRCEQCGNWFRSDPLKLKACLLWPKPKKKKDIVYANFIYCGECNEKKI